MGGAEGGFGARNASKFSYCAPDLRGRRGLKSVRRQISPSALSLWGLRSSRGSHKDKALGHRFVGQAKGGFHFAMLPSPMGGSLQNGNCPEGEKVVKAWKQVQLLCPRFAGAKGVEVR